MKLYKRSDFLKLPAGTIYSRRPYEDECDTLMNGLYCKVSGEDYLPDWVEQDLISEAGFPNGIKDGLDAIQHVIEMRDTYQEFETDLDCAGRDGMFDDDDKFIVWSKNDVQKLVDYLNNSLATAY